VLVHEQRHRGRVLAWVVPSLVLVLLGTLLHVTSEEGSLRRFNPSVASPPFVALMIGCNGLLLAGFYALVEWGGNNGGKSSSGSRTSSASRAKRVLRPLICLGMNSLLVYILSTSGARLDRFARFVYWGNDADHNNVVDWFVSKVLKHTFEFGDSGAQLTYAIIKIAFWSIVATVLAKRAYFWKL
jgi:predicted acyltransferase